MVIHDQAGDLVVFISNDGFLQELLQGKVGQRHPRRHHLPGAPGCDPGQPVAGPRRRGLG
jgi:hypothetical protein